MRRISLLLLFSLMACHAYVPAEVGGPPRGAVVRVHLDPVAPVTLGEVTVQSASLVDGEVVGWSDDQVILSALQVRTAAGQDFLGQGLTVYLPRNQVQMLERRELSRVRTGLLAGAGLVIAALAGVVVNEGIGSGDDNGGGKQPQ